jgi:hypothetical protein
LANGRALSFDILGSAIESLSIDKIEFIVRDRSTKVVTATHEVIEGGIRAFVELTRMDTRALRFKDAKYFIGAKLSGGQTGDELPLAEGTIITSRVANKSPNE